MDKIQELQKQIQMVKDIEHEYQIELSSLKEEYSELVEQLKLRKMSDTEQPNVDAPDNVPEKCWNEIVNLVKDIRKEELKLKELKYGRLKLKFEKEKLQMFDELNSLSEFTAMTKQENEQTIISQWCCQLKKMHCDALGDCSIINVTYRKQETADAHLHEQLSFSVCYRKIPVHITIKCKSKLTMKDSRPAWNLMMSTIISDLACQEISSKGRQLLQSSRSVDVFIDEICTLLQIAYVVEN